MSDKFQQECQDYVDRIKDELNAYYEGRVYKCSNCDEIFVNDDENETCPNCDEEYIEQLGVLDYFDDYLDVDYIINSQGEYKAARIAVTLGGPNVYINTLHGTVELFWGTNQATAWVPYEVCDAINDIFAEFYGWIR